jgi:putative transposase
MAVHNEFLNAGRTLSLAQLCRWLEVPRSTVYYEPRQRRPRPVDRSLELVVQELIQQFPTFGIRRVWAYLRFRLGWPVNRKKVARLMRQRGWTVRTRRVGGRPRTQGSRSVALRPDERWATDVALVFCGAQDGWCSFVPVVDCCTRQVLGWELSLTARAKTAERALETALIARFGIAYGAPEGLTLRHDNGLVFGSKLYRGTAAEYGLRQEFITPYTPEQNGLAERFIRSFKEECVWQHAFGSIEEARRAIAGWIVWYNSQRPHQALAYKTPDEHHASFRKEAAA